MQAAVTEKEAEGTMKRSEFTGEIRYTLMNDYMFKVFFQKNAEALKSLLAALLQIQFEKICSAEIKNPIIPGETADNKTVILDICLILNGNTKIDLEMQVESQGDWPERSLTYLCREYGNMEKSASYAESMSTVQIGILNFIPKGFPLRFFSSYYFYEQECGHLYSDKLNIRMLNLSQINNPENEKQMPELYRWARLFKAKTWEELAQMVTENKISKDFVVTLRELSAEEKIRQQCEAREDYYKVQKDAARYNHDQGYDEGYGEGYEKRAAEDDVKLAEKDRKIAELMEKLKETKN